ncbi:MAG: tetratricopeptide repeat protein [Bryobacteraceae bacterium]
MRVGLFRTLLVLGFAILPVGAAQDQLLQRAAQLDAEQKCDDAERLYQQAVAIEPQSPALLNNLGNHYLTCGAPEKARIYFEQLLKINPSHVNANLQLARLAVNQRKGAKALEYLSRIKERDPEVLLVRAEALNMTGKREEAIGLTRQVAKSASTDPRLLFALGMTYGRLGLYGEAETTFNTVLAAAPDDHDVLYNLGLAATRAGDDTRARSAFDVALRVQPNDVDSLVQLGLVESHLGDYNRAIYLLAQARKQAPQRADAALALARAAQAAGYFGDSLLAYNDYLKLEPGDDLVRRDRAFVLGYSTAGRTEALKELTQYVEKRPTDAIGFLDLAQVSYHADLGLALEQVSHALRLDPTLERAHFIRAWLLHRLGRDQEALNDLQIAIRQNPRDAAAFDLLGLTYANLDKPLESEKALKRAAELSPNDPKILLHLARALVDQGHVAEAQPFLDRFRQVQPNGPQRPREEAGIIETASLTPSERSRRTCEQLRQRIHDHPNDASLRLDLGTLLLADGKLDEAVPVFHDLLAMKPADTVSYRAGTVLLSFEQYALARDFLARSVETIPAARLDLALALFFSEGPNQAMTILEQLPEHDRSGDYFLMKANIEDAAGRSAEADKTLEQGTRYSISRPRLAEDSAVLLLRHNRKARALELVSRAMKSNPNDPELMLTKAVVLSSMDHGAEAVKALRVIESRWPEWDRPYLAEALLMERESRMQEARQRIQIALGLGTKDPVAQCVLAATTGAAAKNQCSCEPGIFEVLLSTCQRP